MRLFIGEFMCGGGFATTPQEEIPPNLWNEGGAMLRAVLADAQEISGLTAVVPTDPRWLPPPANETGKGKIEYSSLAGNASWVNHWQTLAVDCDAMLVIAPENGPLREIFDEMEGMEPQWIGCRAAALDAGICKKTLCDLLIDAGIPTPPTLTDHEIRLGNKLPSEHGWVTKPIDGCGSKDIRRFDRWESVVQDILHGEGQRIAQPFITGKPASCSVICGSSGYIALPAMSQVLDPDSFDYLGGEGPLEGHLLPRAQGLALRTIEALGAGTGGYLGVDLVLGDSADGSQDMIIEVNPRLTTSYIGIRQLVMENILQMMLDLSRGRSVTYRVKPGQIKFTHEGHVWKA